MEASESRPDSPPTSPPADGGGAVRKRRGIVITLTIVASILAFVATFAVWANRQLLETDTWTNTSTRLLENHDIQVAVGGFITDSLYRSVDKALVIGSE